MAMSKLEKIRDEEAEKYANELFPPIHPAWSGSENQACQSGFEAGFDCRDKLNNKALEIAVQALEFYGEDSAWVKTIRPGDCILARDDNSANDRSGMFGGGNKAREALAEIKKIVGEG